MEFFKHDINASEDDKICELLANGGYEMLGYYWRFVEYLYSRGGKIYKDKLNSIAWSLHMDVDKLCQLISSYDLFCEDKECIYSKRIIEALGLTGAIRVSPLHCHGTDDIDKFLTITKELAENAINKSR